MNKAGSRLLALNPALISGCIMAIVASKNINIFQVDSYRKSAVNNMLCMFNFLGREGKLTLVAGCLSPGI